MNIKIIQLVVSLTLMATASAQSKTWQGIKTGNGPGTESISSFGVDGDNNTLALVRYTGDSMLWGNTVIKGKTLRWGKVFGPPISQPAIVKSNQKGDVLWVKTFDIIDSSKSFAPSDIKVSKDGSSTMFLRFVGSSKMRLVLGNDTLLPYQGFSGSSITTLVKMDQNGDIVWHLDINMGFTFVSYINQDPLGNIYLGGMFSNGTNTLTFDTLTINNPNTLRSEIFVVKLNPNGKAIWGSTFGGKYSEFIADLDIDRSGNVYIGASYSSDTVYFANDTLIHPTGGGPIVPTYTCIAKYSSDGTPLWARNFSSQGSMKNSIRKYRSEKGTEIISVTGYSNFNDFKVETHSLGKGLFLLNYQTDGALRSALHFSDTLLYNINDIASDTLGNAYISGSFTQDSMMLNGNWIKNFGPGSATKDIYAIRFDTANTASLLFHIGGDDDDDVSKFSVSETGTIMIAGNYKSNSFFLDTTELTNSAFPEKDMFLASYGLNPNNTGTTKITSSGQLKIYPNPASNILHLEHTLRGNSHSLRLSDMSGKTIKSETVSGSSIEADISTLTKGLYLITLISGENRISALFLKN